MKVFKIEVKLNKEQKALYKLNISAGRVVYNLYVSMIKEWMKQNEKVMNNYEFSKWFNNVYIYENPDKAWLKKASSKHLKDVMKNCYSSLQKYFKKQGGKPKYKKASTDKAGFYFMKNDKNTIIKYQRNKVKIPCIGWITFKEMNYMSDGLIISSGRITKKAGRYFISILVKESDDKSDFKNQNDGIGIDLGIKDFMILSNGVTFENINKSKQIKRLEKSLKRQQRSLSRKYERLKKIPKEERTYKNLEKNKLRIERINYRLTNIREGYINKCIDRIVDMKPNYVTIEDLNISGMMKNHHLAKAIQQSKLYYTKQKLIENAKKHHIEIREVNRWYPSSKTCSRCGEKKHDLTLKDRMYICSKCGYIIDRDLNAAINLKHAKEYKILTKENSSNTTDGLSGSNDCEVSKPTAVGFSSETGHVEAVKSIRCNSSNIDERCRIFKTLNTFEYKL